MTDARRKAYLEAMGIDLWLRRDARPAPPQAAAPAAALRERLGRPAGPPSEAAPAARPAAGPAAVRPAPVRPADRPSGAAPLPVPAGEPVTGLDWAALEARVAECAACAELAGHRSRTVFGVGNRQADWLVIGEAPGAEEDRQGEPFVGRAGKLLNNMLLAVGLERSQVYIANILKCRPPNNRDPRPEEAAACRAFLERQIALVQPRVILALGRIAAQNLLQTDQSLARLRGRVHRLGAEGVPVVVTYHPAYLLRSPAEKGKAWEDLRLAIGASEGKLPEEAS